MRLSRRERTIGIAKNQKETIIYLLFGRTQESVLGRLITQAHRHTIVSPTIGWRVKRSGPRNDTATFGA